MKRITINIPDDCEVQIVRKEKENKEPVIKTYQDLIDNKKRITGYWFNLDCIIKPCISNTCFSSITKDIATTEKIVKSMLAMAMISQLMPYYGRAITDEEWADDNVIKYVIDRIKK